MEDGLVQHRLYIDSCEYVAVLILIVVEDGLVQLCAIPSDAPDYGLNPYCSGRWSRTALRISNVAVGLTVLILIVVEDGLVPVNHSAMSASQMS